MLPPQAGSALGYGRISQVYLLNTTVYKTMYFHDVSKIDMILNCVHRIYILGKTGIHYVLTIVMSNK